MKSMSITVIIIVFLAVALSGCAGNGDSDFTIRVSGSDGVIFTGGYNVTTSTGNSSSKIIMADLVPAQIMVRGNNVSVTFQKQYENGTLKVEILKNGRVVSQSETSDAYGVVEVATKWLVLDEVVLDEVTVMILRIP
jgi:hypothetical protein